MISKDEVMALADLARLKLSPEEITSLQKDISNILEYVGQVSKVSEGTKAAAPLRNVLRPDAPRKEDDALAGKRDALLAALPRRQGDFALVRKIIQKDAE